MKKTVLDEITENEVKEACLDYLKRDYRIAWVERMNTGAYYRGGQLIKYGFEGCADIMAQAIRQYGGVHIEIETKRLKGRKREKQIEHLDLVNESGGIGAFIENIEELPKALRRLKRATIPDSNGSSS